jgi:CheY-like chemotaxis protein
MSGDPQQMYAEVSREGLDLVKALLVQASRNPDDENLWHRLRRKLDILAADARAARKVRLVQVADSMNRIPQGLVEGRYRLAPHYLKLLNLVFEYLESTAAPGNEEVDPVSLAPMTALCERAYNRESFSLRGCSLSEMQRRKKEAQPTDKVEEESEETVRIGIEAVERLGSRLNSVIVHQFQLKKNSEVLQSLESEMRKVIQGLKEGEALASLLKQSEAVLKDLQNLSTGFKEDLVAVDRSSFSLQEEIANLRMLPFQVIRDRLEAPAQSLATRSGTRLELRLEGGETLLDKTILDLALVPLGELLANAVIHGIAEDNVARLTLSCSSDGMTISIGVRDEGSGIDYEGIRDVALSLFPLERETILDMSRIQLSRFLFEPGIQVTRKAGLPVSGEGKGLALVKDAIDAMQGKIGIESPEGHGCLFTLQIPASISMVSGFFVRAGGERFFISAVYVREIVIFNRSQLHSLPGGPAYPLRNEMIPVVPLANVLKGKEALHKDVEQMAVISLLGETWGIILDTIIRYATLGYKKIPDNLSIMKEVQGLVYDEKFNLVPILNIPSILGHIRRLRSIEFRRRYQSSDLSGRNILIVDDSPMSRQTLARVVTEGGFTVDVAEDGIAALELLHQKYFHLIISDDDMPRMDGVTLVENLRKEPEYAKVPVMAMIAERNGEVEQRFRAIGIKDFCRKADFDRHEILRDIRRLLEQA